MDPIIEDNMMLTLSEFCASSAVVPPSPTLHSPVRSALALKCKAMAAEDTKTGITSNKSFLQQKEEQAFLWLYQVLLQSGLIQYERMLVGLAQEGHSLANLKEDQLKLAGVTSIGHRKKLLKMLQPQTPLLPLTPKVDAQEQIRKAFEEQGFSSSFFIPFEQLQVNKKIGEGSFGKVYRGKWLGQNIALKVRHEHVPLKQCVREARVMLQTANPYFILCMGFTVTQEGQPALVTELAENGSLHYQLHKMQRQFSEQQKIKFAQQILLALTSLHGQGYMHCDIKSSNILLDSSWNIKLCDFGLSRPVCSGWHGRIGTPSYMAPELQANGRFTVKSDVYSCGKVMGELLLGRELVEAATRESVQERASETQLLLKIEQIKNTMKSSS